MDKEDQVLLICEMLKLMNESDQLFLSQIIIIIEKHLKRDGRL